MTNKRSAPSTQYHQYDKYSICTQGQIKKNQFKTRRQFHYLHNSKLLVFKLVSFNLSIIVSIKEVESDNKTEDRCQSTHSGIAIMKMC